MSKLSKKEVQSEFGHSGSLDEIEEFIEEDEALKKQRIVVLGGAGHIGSYLCPILAENINHTIICVGRSANRKPYHALCTRTMS